MQLLRFLLSVLHGCIYQIFDHWLLGQFLAHTPFSPVKSAQILPCPSKCFSPSHQYMGAAQFPLNMWVTKWPLLSLTGTSLWPYLCEDLDLINRIGKSCSSITLRQLWYSSLLHYFVIQTFIPTNKYRQINHKAHTKRKPKTKTKTKHRKVIIWTIFCLFIQNSVRLFFTNHILLQ